MADRQLEGSVALITGGSRGIGKACALKLASLGSSIVINYSRNAEHAEAAAREVEALGVRALPVQADIGDRDAIVALFQRTKSEFGRLDILLNSAARA